MPGGRKQPTFIEAARRAQIVACAIHTIATLGYARASLAEIARCAETSKSVISYHFDGKVDLIRQTVAAILGEGTAFMRSRIDAEATAQDMLRGYIEANIAFMQAHREHMVALVEIFSGFRGDDGAPLIDPAAIATGLAPLERILGLGQEQGAFRRFSAQVMAATIRSAIDAIPPQLAADSALDLDAYARELTTLFAAATAAMRDATADDLTHQKDSQEQT